MPITQDRFLAIIDGASALIETHRQIKILTKDSDAAISLANSAVDRTTDPSAREVIAELLGILRTVQDALRASEEENFDLNTIIVAEQKYFARVRRSNERAAQAQRKARVERGVIPRQSYDPKYEPRTKITHAQRLDAELAQAPTQHNYIPLSQRSQAEQDAIRAAEAQELAELRAKRAAQLAAQPPTAEPHALSSEIPITPHITQLDEARLESRITSEEYSALKAAGATHVPTPVAAHKAALANTVPASDPDIKRHLLSEEELAQLDGVGDSSLL